MRSSIILFTIFVGLVQWIAAVGYVGRLNTYWHGTSGDVSIVSPRQIKISNFVYDGQGPVGPNGAGTVHFWYATERPYRANRQKIGSTGPISGRGAYNGQEITINLPVDANKIKWLSLWCDIFELDFGSVEFSVPS